MVGKYNDPIILHFISFKFQILRPISKLIKFTTLCIFIVMLNKSMLYSGTLFLGSLNELVWPYLIVLYQNILIFGGESTTHD